MSRSLTFCDVISYGMEADNAITRDKREFYKRKVIKITNVTGAILTISNKELLQKLEAILPNTKIEAIEINGNMGYISLKDPHQALRIIKSYSTITIDTETYSLAYITPDAMLFFGNLPLSYETRELAKLATAYGVVSRCLVVHSKLTMKSKGYGFVEYINRNHAMQAKLHLGAKYLEGRSLRVDWSDERMREYEDAHATTLFVDKLPRHFLQDHVLNAMFQKHGKVIFCQIATSSSTGISRGFAFVDLATAIDAENAMNVCNNAVIDGIPVRVSYAMPGRPGASILHPKRVDSVSSLLTAFGMTQLPLLNFAQLLAAHGAPLMPAQLTALMVALQNIDGNGNSRMGNSCDQSHHCILPGQEIHSPAINTTTTISTGYDNNNNNNHTDSNLPHAYRQCEAIEEGCYNDEFVYPPDAKYYPNSDMQEYQYQPGSYEDATVNEAPQYYPGNSEKNWSSPPPGFTQPTTTTTTFYDDNYYASDSEAKSSYPPSTCSDEYIFCQTSPSKSSTIEYQPQPQSNLHLLVPKSLHALKRAAEKSSMSNITPLSLAMSKTHSIWGQHEQGLSATDVLKRINTDKPLQE